MIVCFLVYDALDEGDGGTSWECLHGYGDAASTAFEILRVKDGPEGGVREPVPQSPTQVADVACLR